MTEVNTFSAAVDDVVLRSGRPDRIASVVGYVRQSIREIELLAHFSRSLVETTLTATVVPYVWPVPSNFRLFETVRYSSLTDAQGNFIYPKFRNPGKSQYFQDYFFYRSLDTIVFSGVGLNDVIDIAYYQNQPKLAYYAVAARPATYSLEDAAWTYLSGTTDPIQQQAARDLVTHWLLTDWYDVVVEGAIAKLLKATQHPGATSSFALFSSFKKDVLRGESTVIRGLQ